MERGEVGGRFVCITFACIARGNFAIFPCLALPSSELCVKMMGLYPGYIIFFVQSATMIAGSRVLYRWQQATQTDSLKKLLVFINFAYTLLVLNYSSVGFMVLSLQETLAAYGSVHYIGTILPIGLILLGKVITPARPARSKARKDQ
ncbi:Lysophospholipid acyltransferase 1 [Sesamum angolense]|uniref:Lysophospholipid acyltransferase 1 n=1 Tax=Sesamum angolense TaxID=2727404 RepID=A0AAE1WW26_9LAMI|nr:Lysophospholipid acyltransferase 1 [Sesamum angolense]